MNRHIRSVAAIAVSMMLTTAGSAQDAASLVVPIDREPAPKLIVGSPLSAQLANGVAFIPYRVENLRIMPVGGPAAKSLSPRVGHLHITVDDLPWAWADYGQSDTIILINLPRGQHKVRIEVVDPEGGLLTSKTVTFEAPGKPGN